MKTHVRQLARHVALGGLSTYWQARGRLDEAGSVARIHLPYLHAVPPHEEANFRRLLGVLARDHTFVSYSEAVDRLLEGRVDRSYIALSFDDGFASNARTSRILDQFGISACFFIPTGFPGTRTVSAARSFFGYSDGIDEPAMTWGDIEDLLARGHEVGNHTVTHRRLDSLVGQALVDQIGAAAEELRSRLGGVDHFAWPFGRFFHFSEDAARLVFETGHRSCASAERGSHAPGEVPGPNSVCLRRDHIMTSWPLRHQRYFIASSAAEQVKGRSWPAEWEVA